MKEELLGGVRPKDKTESHRNCVYRRSYSKMSLRLAIFGQAPIAIECINKLIDANHEIVVVYAPEDGGRPDALAQHARELDLQVVQRRYFQSKKGEAIPNALNEYKTHNVELNVLASFTYFLPAEITDAPIHKSICYHPSLLPLYRGGNALQWQIIDGAPETGVSIFVPDTGVDTGRIVNQKGGVTIGATDTTGSLFFNKLAPLGVQAILEAVSSIESKTVTYKTQDQSQATFQGLVKDADARIDFKQPAEAIDRLVRGCDPQPGAHIQDGDQLIRLYDASLEMGGDASPGSLQYVDEKGIVIGLRGGTLRLGRIRANRGKEPAQDYVRRLEIPIGHVFDSGRL